MVQQLKYVLYLSRKYSVDCVCRDILPGLFTNRPQANQGTNRQKWVPERLLWFSLCVGMLSPWVRKQDQAWSFLGAAESPPLLDCPPDLNCKKTSLGHYRGPTRGVCPPSFWEIVFLTLCTVSEGSLPIVTSGLQARCWEWLGRASWSPCIPSR